MAGRIERMRPPGWPPSRFIPSAATRKTPIGVARSCSRACSPMLLLATSFEKSLQHDFGYFRGEETLALCNGFHGLRKALREIGFQEVPASPRFQGAAYHLV